jgi:hypothetical protein
MPRNEILNSKMERERCMLNSIEDRLWSKETGERRPRKLNEGRKNQEGRKVDARKTDRWHDSL